MAEASRNVVRAARRQGNDRLKKMEKDKEISQDEEKRGHDEMQKLHDHYTAEINETICPFRNETLEYRTDSGGAGRWRGCPARRPTRCSRSA